MGNDYVIITDASVRATPHHLFNLFTEHSSKYAPAPIKPHLEEQRSPYGNRSSRSIDLRLSLFFVLPRVRKPLFSAI